ncbi:CaiB/BaiF CoA-transferase family protein [Paraburkholderia sp. J67]|uniref:CaiB/BaiF CoA transferase family protein n=1 Tax=Paraburkholderia sp. J67 TaxID=2805435 RepID=UPI002ABD6422|nr:CaiB/BaiF CoA-transferase family protein [Paraburkholderia sp. J67]
MNQQPLGEKPLSGVSVLDFSELAPGPFMTQCLREMGADVLKIERPPHGDGARRMQPGGFAVLNHGKHSRFVDLKDAAQLSDVRDLAARADIVVEGFRPGVMERLGLGYAALAQRNARLVYVSISGYGQSGPLAQSPGHDVNYMATAGMISLSGGLGQPPRDAIGVPVGDFCSSMYALSSALAALLQARTSGVGQHLDVAITDCLTHWMNPRLGHFQRAGIETLEAQRNDVFSKAAYGVFETADPGEYVAVGALEDAFWARLVTALGLDIPGIDHASLKVRKAQAAQINAVLSARLAQMKAAAIVDTLTLADVPVSRVVEPATLAHTPHAVARRLFGVVDGLHYVKFPVKMAGGVGE